jgi:hypothetical protein
MNKIVKANEMFDESKKKFGSVVWKGVELALTQDAHPGRLTFDDWCFRADAMDKDGNLWDVIWYPRPDANEWDKPDFAEMVDRGYYLY